MLWVALAGPATNLIVAVISAIATTGTLAADGGGALGSDRRGHPGPIPGHADRQRLDQPGALHLQLPADSAARRQPDPQRPAAAQPGGGIFPFRTPRLHPYPGPGLHRNTVKDHRADHRLRP